MPTKNDEKEISSEISKTVFFTGKQPLMKFEKKNYSPLHAEKNDEHGCMIDCGILSKSMWWSIVNVKQLNAALSLKNVYSDMADMEDFIFHRKSVHCNSICNSYAIRFNFTNALELSL